jgi:hypothetical protein
MCRPPPSPSATVASAATEELQERLLAREELTWREESLTVPEEKVGISEKALVKVTSNHDSERVKAEANRKEYLDKIETHTARATLENGFKNIYYPLN